MLASFGQFRPLDTGDWPRTRHEQRTSGADSPYPVFLERLEERDDRARAAEQDHRMEYMRVLRQSDVAHVSGPREESKRKKADSAPNTLAARPEALLSPHVCSIFIMIDITPNDRIVHLGDRGRGPLLPPRAKPRRELDRQPAGVHSTCHGGIPVLLGFPRADSLTKRSHQASFYSRQGHLQQQDFPQDSRQATTPLGSKLRPRRASPPITGTPHTK